MIIKNIETRKGAEENILTRSTINIQDGSICLNFNGDHFRFIGVHGNEDYFYHSVLKCFNVSGRFNSIQELRIYLKDMVNYLIPNEPGLQRLFTFKRIDYAQWCLRITRMGEWANTFEIFIFSYVMKINVIGIGNYLGSFSENNMHEYALQLRLPDTFPDKPSIHLYFHKCGHPLEMNNNGNNFAYLEPLSVTIYDSLDNGMQHSHTTNIISQKSNVIVLKNCP